MECHDCFREYWQHKKRRHGEIEQAGKIKMQKTSGTGANSADSAQVINVEREREHINMKRNLERRALKVSGFFISGDL